MNPSNLQQLRPSSTASTSRNIFRSIFETRVQILGGGSIEEIKKTSTYRETNVN